jgi:PBP1b-binding outer membrane lipoprotein LpoB
MNTIRTILALAVMTLFLTGTMCIAGDDESKKASEQTMEQTEGADVSKEGEATMTEGGEATEATREGAETTEEPAAEMPEEGKEAPKE